ncbi:pilus assembly protein [Comamonas sp. C24C]
MQKKMPTHFKEKSLSIAASAVLIPSIATSIELVQAPPSTVKSHVAPNVIISVDDSGSMRFCTNADGAINCFIEFRDNPLKWKPVTDEKRPNRDGTWPLTTRRMNVLKYALIGAQNSDGTWEGGVFRDRDLIPDRKIRLSWQAMWNNGKAWYAESVDSDEMNTNSMRFLEGDHRNNFIKFVDSLTPGQDTPSHKMFAQADNYMRRKLSKNSPWAMDPGKQGAPYLGCRRNYHIIMTDGRWNNNSLSIGDLNRQDNATNIILPDGIFYGGSPDQQRKTSLYRDSHTKTLADWAFYSWGTALQTAKDDSGIHGLKGSIQPTPEYDKAPQTENFGKDSRGKDAILERYWNPKYNPATWPHMVTYTIGFSQMATTWPGAPSIAAPTNNLPFGYDGSFPDFVTGNKSWPAMDNENKRSLDLWHAALNGRGRFYAVEKGQDLEKAFREIFGQIIIQTEHEMSSAAAATSGYNNTRNGVVKFTANYEPKNGWKGFIKAETVRTDGSTVSTPGWNGQNTADKLDALNATGAKITTSNRLILSWSDKWVTDKYKGGVLFQWATDDSKLSSTQKAWLQKKPDGSGTDEGAAAGQNRLNFIRGVRTMEGSESTGYTASQPFRERKSIQGDIINSIIWFTGPPSSNYPLRGYADFTRSQSSRTPMIYAGGNDGMLHGFSATDGSEKIAYIPQGTIPSLGRLTDPTYNQKHRNFVDGSPMTGDIYTGSNIETDTNPGSNWRTMLVGSLGAGGKGYFVLDVTTPGSFATADASTVVKLDRTRSTDSAMNAATAPNCALTGMISAEQAACAKAVLEDRDIGNIIATPVADENNPMRTTQITRMNNNRWAVVMGNGYNSATQRPVLLIQYLDGDMALKRIPVVGTIDASLADIGTGSGIASDNGLAAPRLIDLNGDGLPDIAYAGDNQGNMWKFDLTSADSSNWGVAFNGRPLFTAQGPASLNNARTLAQPITAPPTVRANDRKMTIGTGADSKTIAVGGMMVAFGTGRNATKADENNRNVQTIYSVLDNTRYNLITTTLGPRLQVNNGNTSCTTPNGTCIPVPRALGAGVVTAQLAQQTITELDNGQFGTVGASNDDNKLSASTWPNYNGWYLDLPAVGERQLKPMEFYDGSNILAIYSQVPAKGTDVDPNIESCESSTVDEERQYRTFINIMDGLRPSVQIVDKNNDGLYNALDLNVSRVKVSKGSHTLITQKNKISDIDTKNVKEMLARMPEQSLRPSWHQLR